MLKVKFSQFLAGALFFTLALWMRTGTVVIGGQAEGTDSVPPAQRSNGGSDQIFAVRVQTSVAETRPSNLNIRGRTLANATVTVSAETTGRIIERRINEGDSVSKGGPLCTLDMGARQSKLLQAKAQLKQAEFDHAAVERLSTRGFAAETRVAAMKFALDAAKAALKDIEFDIENTVIRAPVSGIIQDPLAEVGGVLSNGMTCATIISLDPMLMIGQVSEREIHNLAKGMSAIVTLVGGSTVEGKIKYIAARADASTRTFQIKVELPNPNLAIRDGITASASIVLGGKKAHLISPATLTLADDGRIGVRAVSDSNEVQFFAIDILDDTDKGIWIAGLPEKITLITVGQEFVLEGQKIEPVFDKEDSL